MMIEIDDCEDKLAGMKDSWVTHGKKGIMPIIFMSGRSFYKKRLMMMRVLFCSIPRKAKWLRTQAKSPFIFFTSQHRINSSRRSALRLVVSIIVSEVG